MQRRRVAAVAVAAAAAAPTNQWSECWPRSRSHRRRSCSSTCVVTWVATSLRASPPRSSSCPQTRRWSPQSTALANLVCCAPLEPTALAQNGWCHPASLTPRPSPPSRPLAPLAPRAPRAPLAPRAPRAPLAPSAPAAPMLTFEAGKYANTRRPTYILVDRGTASAAEVRATALHVHRMRTACACACAPRMGAGVRRRAAGESCRQGRGRADLW